ncbi:MAG: hypothetical protein EXS50_00685 [Candidatus Taylorbacteria bacterium]|nr:hypothetical protein [Candidatus Taylorbacteria bacterium]
MTALKPGTREMREMALFAVFWIIGVALDDIILVLLSMFFIYMACSTSFLLITTAVELMGVSLTISFIGLYAPVMESACFVVPFLWILYEVVGYTWNTIRKH